jgi:hypothetical protein
LEIARDLRNDRRASRRPSGTTRVLIGSGWKQEKLPRKPPI